VLLLNITSLTIAVDHSDIYPFAVIILDILTPFAALEKFEPEGMGLGKLERVAQISWTCYD
jgi:hypothetical protein